MVTNQTIDEIDANFDATYEQVENWLNVLGTKKWHPSRSCKALVSKIKKKAADPAILLIVAEDILRQEMEHIVQISCCVAEPCTKFAEESNELIKSGSILQVHSNLAAHVAHHTILMSQNLDRQQWLMMLMADLLEADYPGASTQH